MIRSILVPLDDSPYTKAAIQTAIQVARPVNAELLGLHVIDIKILQGPLLRDLTFTIDTVSGFEYREEINKALEAKGRRITADFETICRQNAVKCSHLLETGIISETVSKISHRTDLVVMGKRGENSEWDTPFLGSVVERVVRASSRAVIVTPAEDKPIRRIMVAYDGSQNANRAISMLQDLAGLGDFQIIVVTVNGDDMDSTTQMEEGVEYLRTRGLSCEGVTRIGDDVEEIVQATTDLNADILVMGAYGKSRLRALLLGSTTTRVLRRVDIPVLLYR